MTWLQQPLRLACGVTLPNRLAKAAMSEQLASLDHRPTPALLRLYERWGAGGAGLLITGNVMLDPTALVEPRNVVLTDARDLPLLRAWAGVSQASGAQLWLQINHPGRQAPRFMTAQPVAPSAVPLQVARKAFAPPRALTEPEILQLIERFASTAALARQAGFRGVQIHAAHGYLISQFLSPLTNQRQDAWGGPLSNRMRFLLEIYRAIRALVGSGFPIGVKLNSADFQRGGLTETDSLAVARALAQAGVDLLEISGGTYEQPAMVGTQPQQESTQQREAYFLAYVRQVRQVIQTPLMLTGGFRSAAAMTAAIAEGHVDVIGLARPLAVEPDLPRRLLADPTGRSTVTPHRTGWRALDRLGLLEIVWYTQQLQRLGAGKAPVPARSPWLALSLAGLATCRDLLGSWPRRVLKSISSKWRLPRT
ncbi:MAG: NADH:flavin oxidoreductase/NADH oxidase family protein [Candidatus Tectimicrobiota bacterium]